jgi:signal transduction histidine kinase/streptogramin lyase
MHGFEAAPVAALAIGEGGTVWAGTIGGGLIEIDSASGACRAHAPPADPERDLGDDRVQALLSDPTGDLWVGTYTGLRRLRAESRTFTGIDRADVGDRTVSPLTVSGALEDEKGRLWLADFGGGLFRRDPGGDTFRQYAASTGRSRMGNGLIHMAFDRAGLLWVGGVNGLFRLDPETEEVQTFRHDSSRRDGLGPGYVAAVYCDRVGRIWAGTGEGGLHRLRPDGKTFDVFRPDRNDPSSLSDEYVTVILEDHARTLWVGTRSGGLNALDRSTGRFTRYQPVPEDARSLSHHYVTSLLEDSSGRLWVGTGGGGLDRVEIAAGGGPVQFTRITEKDGLIDDNVMALAEDTDRSLWIATRRGLSRYDPDRKVFVNYGATDLPTSVQFNASGTARGARHIYFASTRGALVADLGTPFPKLTASPTLITSIRSPSGTLTGESAAWDIERIDIPYGEMISFDFAVLDFEGHEHHRYAYLLDSDAKGWTDLGSQRSVTFTGLDPGAHTLTLRGRNARGVWSEISAPVGIVVVPPFWMTSWFRSLVALGALALALGVHGFRVAALERRNRELTAIKVQRESALNEARLKEEQLRGAYDKLRTLTRRLEDAKEEERRRIARELHDEMGQSLTAAKINLRILARPQAPEVGQQRIEDTIGLVDRMIGHVRALSLDLRPPMLDELGLSAALRGYLEAVARRAGIKIDVAEETPIPAVLPAEIAITLFRSVQEAVTNVVRHAAAATVTVRMRRDDGVLSIDVRDDGRGFSVPDALERAARGAHLGLLGLMERVRGMGGEVAIDSSPDRGTKLRIQVPYRG